MTKRKTFLQKRKVRKSIKRRRTIRRKNRKMTGGNYSVATYNGFKNKNSTRVFYPGGSSSWEEHVDAGDFPSRDDA